MNEVKNFYIGRLVLGLALGIGLAVMLLVNTWIGFVLIIATVVVCGWYEGRRDKQNSRSDSPDRK